MQKMLITKLLLKDGGNRVALFEKGHRFPDLTLFDVSELYDVGIDYATLQIGVEVPCRFWAIWEESDKLNQAGNPYKDIVYLEPYDNGHKQADVDEGALLAELRAIRAELRTHTALLSQVLNLDLPAPDGAGEGPEHSPREDVPPDPAPVPAPAARVQPSSVEALNEQQAYRLFNEEVSPAIREGTITTTQASDLARQGSVRGWRDVLAQLRALTKDVKETRERVPA